MKVLGKQSVFEEENESRQEIKNWTLTSEGDDGVKKIIHSLATSSHSKKKALSSTYDFIHKCLYQRENK